MQVSVYVAGVHGVTCCYAVCLTTPPDLTSFPDQQRKKLLFFFFLILRIDVPNFINSINKKKVSPYLFWRKGTQVKVGLKNGKQ